MPTPRARRAAAGLEAAAALLGTAGLVGWQTGSETLSRILPGYAAMQPSTAIDTIALAVASPVTMRAADRRTPATLASTLALLGVVVVLSGTAWASHASDRPYPFTAIAIMTQDEGRMSGITATGHLLLAAALLCRLLGRPLAAHAVGLSGLIVGLIGLYGFAFGTDDLYNVGYFNSIALHTATGIACIGLAVTIRAGNVGFTRLARSETQGGRLVRGLLPAVVAVPSTLGLAAVSLLRHTDLGPGFVIALLSTSIAVASAALVWLVGNQLQTADVRRRDAEDAERRTAAALEEVNGITARLAVANRDLNDFTSAAAHDLRGPLSAVTMGVDILGKRDLAEGERRIVERIRTSAQRGLLLVDELLTYQKIGLGELERSPVSVGAMCAELVRQVELDQQARIDLRIEGTARVLVDPALARQLFTNLIGNAAKYSPGADPVHLLVATYPDGEMVRVAVADQGLPIPEVERSQIFEIFRRGTTAGDSEGTGVGLAICRRIVERHGGRITVEDVEGWTKGFVFTLPAPSSGQDG